MKKKIKRAFTLLEVTLALTILVLIASFTTVHIKKLIDTHRFEKQVGDLFIALQEAQVLSAAYQSDVALDIEQKKGRFFYHFSTDEPFLQKKCSQQEVEFPKGVAIRFKDKKLKALHLDIYSGGRIEPRGVLCFSQSKEEGSRVLYVDLQYGHLIKFCYAKPSLVNLKPHLQKPLKT